MQSLLQLAFPPRCSICGALVSEDFGLCGTCWAEMPFVTGLACDTCGVPLPGDPGDEPAECDDCIGIARPWDRGRAALVYRGGARRFVLALKHGDRPDLARPAARWLARAGAPFWDLDPLLVPVPAHWRRMLARRYNQAAELARALARETGCAHRPDLLCRVRATPILDGQGREARFVTLADAIRPDPQRGAALAGRAVVLVDDVMTTGATLAAAAEAAHAAGANPVFVLVLARVAKDT